MSFHDLQYYDSCPYVLRSCFSCAIFYSKDCRYSVKLILSHLRTHLALFLVPKFHVIEAFPIIISIPFVHFILSFIFLSLYSIFAFIRIKLRTNCCLTIVTYYCSTLVFTLWKSLCVKKKNKKGAPVKCFGSKKEQKIK